ncbi:hypothetical protein GIB67_042294 [Kingdonia uniflora]|uniref:Uncharacterized protein n=1 Tax=Kingdonia uniflora TaxID=39325 RepID=A0A7J7LDY1_9MAGN|nr:hypothetical protein GIB67_042294 [Kingdonia uniflora]
MKQDRKLNDVVREQYVKSIEKLPAKLEEKKKECNLLQDINAKLLEQSERQHPEPVPLIASNYRWVAKCKADTTIHDKKIQTLHCQLIIVEEMKKKFEVEHYEWEAWRQAMKKEFHSGELAEKDDPTFIELFDQYDRFYTIAQQGPKGDYQEDFTMTGGNQDKLMDVRRANVVLKKKINETLFQLYVMYHLDVRGVQGEDDNSTFRVPTTIKHQSQNQFKKVMNSLESLLTKDPEHFGRLFSASLWILVSVREVVVFISNREAYTLLPLFWVRKNNHISNQKRFENLVGDTIKFMWVGLGLDNQYVRLFTRYGAPMPPVSTLWLAHVDLGLRGDFQRDMVQKWFGVTNKLFKALLKENNVKGYKLNDLI